MAQHENIELNEDYTFVFVENLRAKLAKPKEHNMPEELAQQMSREIGSFVDPFLKEEREVGISRNDVAGFLVNFFSGERNDQLTHIESFETLVMGEFDALAERQKSGKAAREIPEGALDVEGARVFAIELNMLLLETAKKSKSQEDALDVERLLATIYSQLIFSVGEMAQQQGYFGIHDLEKIMNRFFNRDATIKKSLPAEKEISPEKQDEFVQRFENVFAVLEAEVKQRFNKVVNERNGPEQGRDGRILGGGR